MVFGLSKTRVSPIAVDFGADSLKLLQVTLTDPPQIVAAAMVDVPEHARGEPAARHAFFAESLRFLLRSQPFKGNRAICSIPAYQTLVQHLQIHKAEMDDFDNQVAAQLRQRLNIDPSRMVVRTVQVGPVVRDGTPRQEVICLAAGRDAVMRHIDTARRGKLDVVGMHCEHQALLRAFSHLYRRAGDADRTTCFIDIGGATTKLVIAHGPELVFAKTIHAAGDHFTRQRAQLRSQSFSDARAQRVQEASSPPSSTELPGSGLASPARAAAPSGLAVIEAQIAAERTGPIAVSPVTRPHPSQPSDHGNEGDALECLIDELQLCCRYHQSMFPARAIEKLIFLGGESHHVDICQTIARSLRIGAQLGDPLARLIRSTQKSSASGIDMRQPQPGWAVPLGLCLSDANL